MLKICGNWICKPSTKNAWAWFIFLGVEKGKYCPYSSKGDKQCLKNYRPVSLLPFSGKMLEINFWQNVPIFLKNKLIATNQSGFKPGDSCINQLLSITHDIYKSFDEGYEVMGVFLDIPKAFDKIWHKSIIFQLKQNGISGNLLELLADFLKDRGLFWMDRFPNGQMLLQEFLKDPF